MYVNIDFAGKQSRSCDVNNNGKFQYILSCVEIVRKTSETRWLINAWLNGLSLSHKTKTVFESTSLYHLWSNTQYILWKIWAFSTQQTRHWRPYRSLICNLSKRFLIWLWPKKIARLSLFSCHLFYHQVSCWRHNYQEWLKTVDYTIYFAII